MNDPRTALRALENRYEERGRLFLLHLDLTWRCPLTCPHCYLAGAQAEELEATAWIRLLDEAKAQGVAEIVLSGGDPMLRKDFDEVLLAARARGFAVVVKTTGLLLGEADADRFARLGWVLADISLHSIDPAIHDAFTGRPGAWSRTVAAIEGLRSRNVPVRVARSLVEGIPGDGGALRQWASDRGCRFIESSAVIRRRDGSPAGCGVLDEASLVEAVVGHFAGRPAPQPRPLDPDAAPCSAGGTRLYVTPSGDVTPCVAWPRSLGRLRDGGLARILASPELARVRRLRNADRGECMTCDLRTTCEFCPGQAELLAGRPDARYDAACSRARMFARALERLDSSGGVLP